MPISGTTGRNFYDCMVYYQGTWMRGRTVRTAKDGGTVVEVHRLNSASRTRKTFPSESVMMNRA